MYNTIFFNITTTHQLSLSLSPTQTQLHQLPQKENMKTHSCETTLAASKLVIHNDSHTISKQKPKIRIIHIVAPEIIKTDVENFRELVQRLTGKPLGKSSGNMKKTKKEKNVSPLQSNTHGKKNTQSAGAPILQKGENPNTFLSFLGDHVDGFMYGMNEFPLLPFRSSQINTFGHEMPLC